jgi:hypothetical protein
MLGWAEIVAVLLIDHAVCTSRDHANRASTSAWTMSSECCGWRHYGPRQGCWMTSLGILFLREVWTHSNSSVRIRSMAADLSESAHQPRRRRSQFWHPPGFHDRPNFKVRSVRRWRKTASIRYSGSYIMPSAVKDGKRDMLLLGCDMHQLT